MPLRRRIQLLLAQKLSKRALLDRWAYIHVAPVQRKAIPMIKTYNLRPCFVKIKLIYRKFLTPLLEMMNILCK